MITLLLDPERLALAQVRVEGPAYRHLFRARRLAVGERLRAVDGRGAARWAEVAAVARAEATLRLGEAAAVCFQPELAAKALDIGQVGNKRGLLGAHF